MHERFVKSFDGVDLFVTEQGEGPAIVLCDGLGCDGFIWRYLKPMLATRHRVVHWHYRGHGHSRVPWDHPNISVDVFVRDLLHVMDELGLEKPVLLGHSMGVQILLEFALRNPTRVKALVPICGSYGRPLDTFHGNDLLGRVFPLLHGTVMRFPKGAQRFWTSVVGLDVVYAIALLREVDGRIVRREDFKPYFDHLSRMDVRTFVRVLDDVRHHSVEHALPEIKAPTLVIAADRDTFTPVDLSIRMAELIPGAELCVIPGASHVAPIENRELVELRIEKFLAQRT
jgi:pimeloyl-ACP methyl ester carboxylesterase